MTALIGTGIVLALCAVPVWLREQDKRNCEWANVTGDDDQ